MNVKEDNKDLDNKELIRYGYFTCVVQNEEETFFEDGIGVKPLLKLYEYDKLRNSKVFDKVIGKAAAIICSIGGAGEVFAETMSKEALEFLLKNNIEYSYDNLVNRIQNRSRTGFCPLESSVMEIDDLDEGLKAIKDTIKELMRR